MSGGYFGHLAVHPGLFVNSEWLLKQKIKVKEKKKGDKVIAKEWLWGPGLTYYHHTGNSNVYIPGVELIRRKSSAKRFYRDFALGSQFLWLFNAGESFRIDENGEVKKGFLASDAQFGISTSIGWGWKIQRDQEKLRSLYISPQVIWLLGYNDGIAPMVSMKLGYRIFNKTPI